MIRLQVTTTRFAHYKNMISGETDGFVQVDPKKYFYPVSFAIQFYNFKVRFDDIWMSTF